MTKFIKTLIIINGLLIPLIILFVFVNLIKELAQNTSYRSEDGINTKNLTVNKKGETIALQGISYEKPERILNTGNYIMAVSPKTYEEPKKMHEVSLSLKCHVSDNSECYLNFIFFDNDYNCIGKLVDKKASIKEYSIPENEEGVNHKVVTNIKNIAYLISFKDTNKDGVLNGLDRHDLYISSITGTCLTKVTENMNIIGFRFVKNNSELFITYQETDSIRDEYKNNKFAVYNINSHKLNLLKSVDKTIAEINDILNKNTSNR